jgi:hypothetical protein
MPLGTTATFRRSTPAAVTAAAMSADTQQNRVAYRAAYRHNSRDFTRRSQEVARRRWLPWSVWTTSGAPAARTAGPA